jgi:hypothetical protein
VQGQVLSNQLDAGPFSCQKGPKSTVKPSLIGIFVYALEFTGDKIFLQKEILRLIKEQTLLIFES